MAKRKMKKFAELETFDNVLRHTGVFNGQLHELRGKWASERFGNDNPITLELACGKGDYTIGLAKREPNTNFVGVDIKGDRIWRGAKTAIEAKLDNVAFLRTQIETIHTAFAPNEVSEIWITFPDPYLRKGKAMKRLTSSRFLTLYRKILKPGGMIHLKTDEDNLYEFSLETVAEDKEARLEERVDNVYTERPGDDILGIQTYYEKKHLEAGKTIKYMRFTIN